jgi:hypothetical protein
LRVVLAITAQLPSSAVKLPVAVGTFPASVAVHVSVVLKFADRRGACAVIRADSPGRPMNAAFIAVSVGAKQYDPPENDAL